MELAAARRGSWALLRCNSTPAAGTVAEYTPRASIMVASSSSMGIHRVARICGCDSARDRALRVADNDKIHLKRVVLLMRKPARIRYPRRQAGSAGRDPGPGRWAFQLAHDELGTAVVLVSSRRG